jgi:hypothetical protein
MLRKIKKPKKIMNEMKKVIDKRRIKRNSQKDKERKRERVTQ